MYISARKQSVICMLLSAYVVKCLLRNYSNDFQVVNNLNLCLTLYFEERIIWESGSAVICSIVITPREGMADRIRSAWTDIGLPVWSLDKAKSILRSFRFSPFSSKQFSEENLVIIIICIALYIVITPR